MTAPHTCVIPESKDPGCDAHTAFYASIVARTVSAANLFENVTPRGVADPNRAEGRNTPIRRQLRKCIASSRISPRTPPLVVDVHSFAQPSDYELSSPTDVVLLSIPMPPDDTALIECIADGLLRRHFRIAVLEGSLANDLHVESRNLGAVSLLLELWQGLNAREVAEIAHVIAQCAQTESKKKKTSRKTEKTTRRTEKTGRRTKKTTRRTEKTTRRIAR